MLKRYQILLQKIRQAREVGRHGLSVRLSNRAQALFDKMPYRLQARLRRQTGTV